MEQRNEVIMAGLGGKGVLLAGDLLARSAMAKHKYVTWFPSYFGAVRGGACECTVLFSDDYISSPVLTKAQTVIVFEPSQIPSFDSRIRPGGALLIESSGSEDIGPEKDIRVYKIPAVDTAFSMGNSQVSNSVLLGAYVGVTGVIQPELIEAQLGERFKTKSDILSLNIEALRKGIDIGESLIDAD